MHLARQKVQVTFFSREMTFRKEQKNSFCGESHSSCSQNFFVLFWCIWQGKKYKWRSFLERWCSFCLFVKRAILHVVKRNNFFVLFWCIWQGKKYKWRSFLERWWHSERNKKKCSFCGESHSSSKVTIFFKSTNDSFQFCPFLMHLERQKTILFWENDLFWRKEKKNAILHVVKRNNFLSFSDAFGKAKSTNDVLF